MPIGPPELTIDTFGPFYEEHFRPLVGETIFTNQHGNWRADYHRRSPRCTIPASASTSRSPKLPGRSRPVTVHYQRL